MGFGIKEPRIHLNLPSPPGGQQPIGSHTHGMHNLQFVKHKETRLTHRHKSSQTPCKNVQRRRQSVTRWHCALLGARCISFFKVGRSTLFLICFNNNFSFSLDSSMFSSRPPKKCQQHSRQRNIDYFALDQQPAILFGRPLRWGDVAKSARP